MHWGIGVVSALALQPLFGILHHIKHKRTGKPTWWGTLHRWYGRLVMLFGAMNGTWGLASKSESGDGYWELMWVYIGVFVAVAVVYICIISVDSCIKRRRRKRALREAAGNELVDMDRGEYRTGERQATGVIHTSVDGKR